MSKAHQDMIGFITHCQMNTNTRFLSYLISEHPHSIPLRVKGHVDGKHLVLCVDDHDHTEDSAVETHHLLQILLGNRNLHCYSPDQRESSNLDYDLKDLFAQAIKANCDKLIDTLLGLSTDADRLKIVHEKGDQGGTMLHLAVIKKSKNGVIESILRSVPTNQDKVELINMEDCDGLTALHHATEDSTGRLLKVLLGHLDDHYEALNLQATKQAETTVTVFQCASTFLSDEAVLSMLESVTIDDHQLFDLLTKAIMLKENSPAVHLLASENKFESLNLIFSMLSQPQQMGLFLSRNRKDSSFIDLVREQASESSGHLLLLSFWHQLLLDGIHALIPNLDQQFCWDDLLNHPDGLSVDEIKRISSWSQAFAIPRMQSKMKAHAFVFVNITDRPGAEEEAKDVIDSLQCIGLNVYYKEWEDFDELLATLKEKLTEIRNDCAFLSICIMAHGFGGHVQGSSEGSHGKVNELLGAAHLALPEFVPLVYLFQLCQKIHVELPSFDSAAIDMPEDQETSLSQLLSSSDIEAQSDAHRGYADDVKARAIMDSDVIILQRPNTIMLHSTVADGYSFRGEYTRAIAKQIKNSDGRTDIYTMHTRAAEEVKKNQQFQIQTQTPKYESTATKTLCLPPRIAKTPLL